MRRRFGRGRRRENESDGKRAPIDARLWLTRVVDAKLVDAAGLDPATIDGISDRFAALGVGQRSDGRRVFVAVSPNSGGDAVLAALAFAGQQPADAESGELIAISPNWSSASRRLLSVVRPPPAGFRAIGAPALGDGRGAIEPEVAMPPHIADRRRVADLISRDDERDLFVRALTALEGLAAKHGGAVRGVGEGVEFVLMARPVAVLSAVGGRVQLEARLPDRAQIPLEAGSLATALDRLEGLLRKRLNDRKVRNSEDGLRTALLPILERATEARWCAVWPLPGSDPEVIDLAAVRADGKSVLAAARENIGLATLGSILDVALASGPALATLAARDEISVRSSLPELVLAAKSFDAAALGALRGLDLRFSAFDVATRRNGALSLEPRPLAAPTVSTARDNARAQAAGRSAGSVRGRESAEGAGVESPARRERSRSRGRPRSEAAPAEKSSIEELSLFDLDDDARSTGAEEEGGAVRRRRGRGRRRGGRRGGAAASDVSSESAGDPGESASDRSEVAETSEGSESSGARRRSRAPRATEKRSDDAPLIVADDDDDTLAPLSTEAPEPDEVEIPTYEEEDEGDDGEAEEGRANRIQDLQRRARAAKAKAEAEAPPRPPRRPAAFIAHADRASVLTAVLLARDVRLVEGFWIYPQQDLMTFFRNIATDLREETPIFLVGFAASPPARDTFQAAALYRGRLDWFDHHVWPPEDLQGLREAIGEDNVHIQSGTENSVAAVLAQRTRRSRFSDKLVELVTGRFSEHDYERWGRLWWHRAGELAEKHGERRSEIDSLLIGRPSDLAREAAKFPTPELPPELAYVSGRDFRLVHFGGFSMVVTPVPADLDLHLTARIARERYEAHLSLAYRADDGLIIIGGDESRSRRGLDLGRMANHLSAKHEWIESLADDDHVARIRVSNLSGRPDRLEEVIGEIAMGRSIVES